MECKAVTNGGFRKSLKWNDLFLAHTNTVTSVSQRKDRPTECHSYS